MKCKLSDIAVVTMGQSPKGDTYNKNGDGMPFLQGNRTFGDRYPTFDTWTTSPTKIAEAGDVIMSVRAPVGDLNITSVQMCLGRGVCSIRAINGNQDFIYYLMKYSIEQLLSKESGTVFGSVNRNDINGLDLDIPEDSVIQQKIARYLTAIDEKIEVNKQINENLEQQAVLLFRSWFTTFSQSESVVRQPSEFGQIPENFSIVKVGSLKMLVTDYVANGSFASLKENVTLYQEPNYAYFIRNTDLKSGSFEVFVDQHSYEFLSKSTLYGGEIIISNVGDVGSVFLCPKLDGPMTLGNNIIMLRPEDDSLRYYLYIWFKHLQGQAIIQGIKGGSAQPKFNKTDFKNTSILLPPVELLSRFHDIVSPMFELISRNQAENKRLSALRDSLLPRLMSGELDVSSIDL